jgi:gliding motility-associated-like protein
MKRVLLFLSVLLFSAKVNASHITGAEITYTSLGNNQYEVHMFIYWDCTTGFNPGSSQSLSVDGCGGSQFVTMNQSANTPGDGVDISQICNSATSTCNNGTVNGNNMIEYDAIVTLPSQCTDWVFSWSTCCRGGNIINLSGGQSAGNYAYATLNNVAAPNNNSPFFTAQPLPYLCVNQPACYNFGVVEVDGNTLQYSLIPAQDAANSPLAYNSPYSGTEPLSGITIDPNTGQINFTPTTQGAFIVCVQVQEFDANGVLVGTIIRDVQVVVQNCNNQTIGCGAGGLTSANVTGNGAVLNPSNPHEIQICEGIPFSFDVTFTDPNATDSLYIGTNLATNPALVGATVTTSYPIPSQPNNISMHFSWTAPPGSSGQNTFLTVTVYDNACPIPGQQVVNYYLNILPAANAGPDTTICLGDGAVLHGTGPGGPYNWYDLSNTMIPVSPQFSCNPCQTPTVSPTTVGAYTYVIQTGGGAGCVNRDTVVITVVPTFNWALTPGPTAAGCTGNPIQLGVTPNPVGVYTYSWSPATDLSQTIVQNPTTTFTLPGTQTYSVTMTSQLGCVKHDSITVTVQQGPPPFSVPNDSCMTNPTTVPLTTTFNCLSSVSCALSNACPGGAAQNFTAGTGSAPDNSSFDWPTPYGNWYRNSRHQFLVLASELTAMGVTAGNINSIAFNVTATNSIGPLPNYTIKMMCTNLTALPAAIGSDNFVPGTVQVYNTPTLVVTTGMNVHTFTQPYAWDGTSNLIIETCFDQSNPSYTNNASVTQSTTSFISSINAYSDSDPVCTSPINVMSFVSFNDYMQRPDMTFNVTSSVNSANYTYSWQEVSTNPPNTIGIANPNAQNTTVALTPGTHTYAVTVTTLNGLCSRTDSVTYVIGGTGADVVTLDSVFCSTDPVGQFFLSPTTPLGGTWSHHVGGSTNPGGGVIPAGATADFHPELSVLGTSYVIYTVGPADCAIQDSVQVQVFQKIPANFTTIGPFCEYDPAVTLSTIANNAGGTWTIDGTSATTFDPPTLGPSTPPGYQLKYKTDLGVGCPDSVTKLVEVFPAPQVDFNADTVSGCLPSVPIAFTSSVTTTPASSNAYAWSFGDASTSTLANPIHIYTVSGSISVSLTFTDNHGCVDTETKSPYITINPVPNPDFMYDPANPTSLEPHVEFFNTTSNTAGLSWNWTIMTDSLLLLDTASTFNTNFDFPTYGTYMITLRATTVNGCEDDITKPLQILPDYSIYVPSSFTPNGDGKNDVFICKTNGVQVEDYTMSIYDRWGTKIFSTNDITEGWKGSKGNSDNIVNESGMYIWKIIYKDAFLKGHTITGHVTVIR